MKIPVFRFTLRPRYNTLFVESHMRDRKRRLDAVALASNAIAANIVQRHFTLSASRSHSSSNESATVAKTHRLRCLALAFIRKRRIDDANTSRFIHSPMFECSALDVARTDERVSISRASSPAIIDSFACFEKSGRENIDLSPASKLCFVHRKCSIARRPGKAEHTKYSGRAMR